jgi:hypothetical protein
MDVSRSRAQRSLKAGSAMLQKANHLVCHVIKLKHKTKTEADKSDKYVARKAINESDVTKGEGSTLEQLLPISKNKTNFQGNECRNTL